MSRNIDLQTNKLKVVIGFVEQQHLIEKITFHQICLALLKENSFYIQLYEINRCLIPQIGLRQILVTTGDKNY